MSTGKFTIEFHASGRGKAQCESNPDFPDGKDIRLQGNTTAATCVVNLPYPAPECGMYAIKCHTCQIKVGVTAVGRGDDPKSVEIPCKTFNGTKGH